MTEEQRIVKLYKEMYTAMMKKNRAELERIHDDSFFIVHMTGMRQSKSEYIDAIMNGTMNYYGVEHEEARLAVNGDTAALTGRSRVNAAVFGGGKHTWRLQLDMRLVKNNGEWKFTSAGASTY